MTGRHHYSIPGASFLKPRSSSKTQAQKTAATKVNVPSSSRDTRQPSSSRAYYSQEAVASNTPVRPPSATGYRTQHSNTSINNFHASSNARQTHGQRSTTMPPASASRTRLDVPDPRNYFSKMFSRKQTPAPVQAEEKQKSSQKHQRGSQVYTAAHVPAAPIQTPYHAGPSTSRTAHDASLQTRDSDRDDRVRQKSRDERTKEERERMRAEYAAYRAKVQEMERVAAATSKMAQMDRTVSRPPRDERRQQEYESDNAKRRVQAQQLTQSANHKQEVRQSYYLHPAQASAVYRGATPLRESQQSLGPHATGRPPGVPIQPSTSSQSTSASNQVHASHPAPPVTRPEPNVAPSPLPAAPVGADPAPPPPPKMNSAPYQTENHPHQYPLQQKQASPTMLPPYQVPRSDDKYRLEREAAERDALSTQDRERADREREASRRREAAERDAAASRERERERELERRRESEKQLADREIQERERELEREKKRCRRAERERKKELENAERERRKEHENAERERQKQAEREHRALEHSELDKQREADRLRRERKDQERAERLKTERERQESERLERDRLRERTERDRERAVKPATKHRSHRDKSYSMPTNVLLGATSGSDTDRMTSRKDGRHRSHSQSAVMDPQHHTGPSNTHRPDSRKDAVYAPGLGAVHKSVSRRDVTEQLAVSQQFPKAASTPTHSQTPHDDNTNLRNASAVPFSTQTQELVPPTLPERSRTDPVLPPRESIDAVPSDQPIFEGVQSKLVSIYASQGPSDRAALRATQKSASGHPTSDQRQPMSTSAALPASIAHEGYPRSSLDQPSRRTSFAQPNVTPPIGPVVTSTIAPQPQHEISAPTQEILTQHSTPPQSRASGDGVSGRVLPGSRPLQQERILPTPQGQVSPFPDAKHLTAAQSARQPVSVVRTQPMDERSESFRPAVNASYGVGFSSYSQTVFGSSADQTRITGHNPQVASMSRAPSNNSTKSRNVQPPPETPTGGFQGMPVSRTASDASHSTHAGERQQSAAFQAQPQSHAAPSQRLSQLTPTTPIYSSAPKVSSTPRVKHESFTNFHAQPVLPSHSHSQPSPQQTLSPYHYNSSKDDIDLSSHDNLPAARARSSIPASTPDVAHQQYPPTQVPSSQGKISHTPSTNAHLPVQPQPLHATMPPSIQDHRSSLRPTMNSNNVPPYSAPVTSPDAMSQMPSTMFSHQQSMQQPNLSMYHNHSTSRNVSAQQAQHYQHVLNAVRPSLPQHNNSQASNAASKPPLLPRSANPGVYVTSTRQNSPYLEDSPSSLGGGLSLDSPQAVKPSLQHSQHDSEHPTHQSTYNRSQSQGGPPTPVVHGSHQPQQFIESRKSARPQELDTLPPLTPSSSRDSHEEILMTPASLNQSRPHVNVKQPSDGSQRPEKKKGGGLLRLFRSSSTKSNKDKDRVDPREEEARRKVPGSQRDQRTESLTKSRSARPPSILRTAESESNPKSISIVPTPPVNDQVKHHRASKHVPPPISIPPLEPNQFRLCSSKSKRYRTMSIASMEAVDGTANNTVVGSPTSSRRSPTPSGPLTPSVRDPIEAAQAWRDNEDVFLDPGSQRRRRPGVTFDLKGDEGQKDGAVYRRVNRLHRQRRDSLR